MKKIKNILFICIFSLIMSCQAVTINAASLSSLKSGIYKISNDVSHENETGMSMARTYLNESMTLKKSNGNWYYTIKFSGASYMNNHRVYINGNKVSTKSKNSANDTIELTFKTNSITPNLKVRMYVGPMERDVEFGVIPKESTLKLVKATEESSSGSSTNSSSSTVSSSNKTNSSSNKTNNSSNSSTKTETKSDKVEEEEKEEKEETQYKTSKEETQDKTSKEETKEESEKEIKEEAEETIAEKEAVEKTTEEVVSESSDEKSSNKTILMGAGAIVIIAITVLALRRIKK